MTRKYMLTATVRQAELHCSARKRQPREHTRVSNVHTRMPLHVARGWSACGKDSPRKGQPGYTDALTSCHVRSVGLPRETFTFLLVYTVYGSIQAIPTHRIFQLYVTRQGIIVSQTELLKLLIQHHCPSCVSTIAQGY